MSISGSGKIRIFRFSSEANHFRMIHSEMIQPVQIPAAAAAHYRARLTVFRGIRGIRGGL